MSLPGQVPASATRVRRQLATLRHYHEIAERRRDRPPLLRHERLRRRAHHARRARRRLLRRRRQRPGRSSSSCSPRPSAWACPGSTARTWSSAPSATAPCASSRSPRSRSLQDTDIASASRYATIVIAARRRRSRRSSAALIVMIPFLFTCRHLASTRPTTLAVVVGLVELFCLGIFLGSHLARAALARRPQARPRRRRSRSSSACCSAGASGDARGGAGSRTARRGRTTRCSPASTSEQRKAVTHVDGPLLILAGAGSGKTRVLTHRVAWLIQVQHVRPDEVVAITFTNKAAGEMKERIEGLVGPVARTMWISTFHSMCARLLRREAQRMGYKSTFTIHDEDDRRRLIKRCMEELERRPQAVPAGVAQPPDQRRQEPAARARPVPRAGRALRAGRPPTSTSSTRSATPR